MIALLFSRVGLVFMGLVAGIALLTGTLLYGVSLGQQREREAMLRASIEAYDNRQGIDHEVDSTDRVSLCVELGGLRHECIEQLRRVDATTPTE